MKNLKLLLMFSLFPFLTFAHGFEILGWVGIELFVIIGLVLFITLIDLTLKKRLILGLIFLISEIGIMAITQDIPYSSNMILINLLSLIIPVVSVLCVFWILKRNK